MKCPHCNETDHEPTAKYCHVCGKALNEEPPKPPKSPKFGVLKGALVILVAMSVLFGFYHWLSNRPRPDDPPSIEKKIGSYAGKTSFDTFKIAIDLGLPSGTKWANCNVGASQPWEHGGYYAWGETEEKAEYWYDTYKHYRSFLWGLISFCHGLGDNICGTKYDVAHVKWGGRWQMPTLEQIEELLEICKCEWTTLNGVTGYKFTGPNNNYIFLPAAGYRESIGFEFTEPLGFGSCGKYWSGTQDPAYKDDAHKLSFYEDDKYQYSDTESRVLGLSVRPVVAGFSPMASSSSTSFSRRVDPNKYDYLSSELQNRAP